MNLTKLENTIITNNAAKDKLGNIIEINDVILYAHNNELKQDIVVDINFQVSPPNIIISDNKKKFAVSCNNCIIINSLLHEQGINPAIIVNDKLQKLKPNNIVYLLYAVIPNEESGLIFMKPDYKGLSDLHSTYTKLITKYPGIILIPFSCSQDYIQIKATNNTGNKSLSDFIHEYNIPTRYKRINTYCSLTNSLKLSIRQTNTQLFTQSLNNFISISISKLNKLKYEIDYNTLLPFTFDTDMSGTLYMNFDKFSVIHDFLNIQMMPADFKEAIIHFHNYYCYSYKHLIKYLKKYPTYFTNQYYINLLISNYEWTELIEEIEE
jgi:hypothetical protein